MEVVENLQDLGQVVDHYFSFLKSKVQFFVDYFNETEEVSEGTQLQDEACVVLCFKDFMHFDDSWMFELV